MTSSQTHCKKSATQEAIIKKGEQHRRQVFQNGVKAVVKHVPQAKINQVD